MIKIRGIEFKPEPYTDRDLMRLAAATGDIDLQVDEAIAERNAAQIVRRIFPAMPEAWTANDRLHLHSAEVARIITELKNGLLQDTNFVEALDPLKNLPIGEAGAQGIERLQQEARSLRSPARQYQKPRKYRHH